MRNVCRAVGALAVLGAAGCGVTSQDEPQPLEETSIQQPPAPPSVDTGAGPTPTISTSSASPPSPPTTRPPSESPSGPPSGPP